MSAAQIPTRNNLTWLQSRSTPQQTGTCGASNTDPQTDETGQNKDSPPKRKPKHGQTKTPSASPTTTGQTPNSKSRPSPTSLNHGSPASIPSPLPPAACTPSPGTTTWNPTGAPADRRHCPLNGAAVGGYTVRECGDDPTECEPARPDPRSKQCVTEH